MRNKKLMKKVLLISLSATIVFAIGSSAYANTLALPNGTIITQNGTKFLTDSKGEKYAGWFIDSKEDWYYFNESDKTMKTGWQHDNKDGYWYYLNLSDGKMVTGWKNIDGKEYFFQPVRDMGNYHFNNEQEKWLYSVNNKVPYGAMYVNATTPDGSKVDSAGVKVVVETSTQTVNNNSLSDTDTVKNGWVSESGKWHYYENGALAKNKWLNLDGKWYYVLSDGAMLSNTWKKISDKYYYFGADGAIYVNTTTPDGYRVDQNGEKTPYVIKGLQMMLVTNMKIENGICYLTGEYWDMLPYDDLTVGGFPYDTTLIEETIMVEVNSNTVYLPYNDYFWSVKHGINDITNINELVEEINRNIPYGTYVLLDLEGNQVKTIRGAAFAS